MKNKGLIAIIITLSIIIAILISLVVVLLINPTKINFGVNKNYQLIKAKQYSKENINTIKLNLTNSNFELKLSNDNMINVEYYGKDKDTITYDLKQDILSINEINKHNFCFGLCDSNTKTIIYIPEDYSGNLEIETVSGDVEVNRINDTYINAKTVSGELEIYNNNKRNDLILNIATISGDIEIE